MGMRSRTQAVYVISVAAELAGMHPYLMAAVAGYAAGLVSLSRNYIVPTYLVIGVAHVYLNMVSAYLPLPAQSVTMRLIFRVLVLSAVTVVAFYILVRMLARWSGS